MTRPASRRVPSSSPPFSSGSTSARTAAISSRSGKRVGAGMAPQPTRPRLRGLDLHDLELELRAPRRRDLDRLALLAAHDRLADRRLVRELPLGRVRLRRADDEVLDGLLRVHVAESHDRADRDDARIHALRVDEPRVHEPLLELRDAVLEHHLLVLRVVVFRVLGDLAELAGRGDALCDLPAALGTEVVELSLQLLEALGSEDHVLHEALQRWCAGAGGPPNGPQW